MDQHKIENFMKAYPGVAFPAHLHLDRDQARAMRESIARSVDSPGAQGLVLVEKLNAVSTEVTGFQADDDAFSVARLLRESGVIYPENVYLNWYQFDDIDQIRLADLDQYFSDIWYPSADDLDVFDESGEWVVSIAHHGKVRFFGKANKNGVIH